MDEDRIICLMPVFNDWNSVERLLKQLDETFAGTQRRARILLVDDGSTEKLNWPVDQSFAAIDGIDILLLRRNLGHQRAICVGLCYVEEKMPCDLVVVMDSDGEDDPRDIPRLLDKCREQSPIKTIVFAERTKRSENLVFRACYTIYRVIHFVLVGHRIRVGNFSVIPAGALRSLTVVPELWNHYAAAVFTARLSHCGVPTERAKRLDGDTTMGWEGLVVHGLSAISAFSDRVGVRLLTMISPLILATVVSFIAVVAVRVGSGLSVPSWAAEAGGLLLVLLFELLFFAFLFCFLILSGRSNSRFLPARDYAFFVDRLKSVYPRR